MAKVVTMGEILLRLSTKDYKKFMQADEFEACFGGSEEIGRASCRERVSNNE